MPFRSLYVLEAFYRGNVLGSDLQIGGESLALRGGDGYFDNSSFRDTVLGNGGYELGKLGVAAGELSPHIFELQ